MLVIIVTTVAIMLLAFVLYYPYSAAGRQESNMAKARAHLPKVQPLIQADSRFAKVKASEGTAMGGCLGLYGCVKSEEDLHDLKQTVTSTSPPVPVSWHVQVVSPELWEEADR
jgi:hypothetical protein